MSKTISPIPLPKYKMDNVFTPYIPQSIATLSGCKLYTAEEMIAMNVHYVMKAQSSWYPDEYFIATEIEEWERGVAVYLIVTSDPNMTQGRREAVPIVYHNLEDVTSKWKDANTCMIMLSEDGYKHPDIKPHQGSSYVSIMKYPIMRPYDLAHYCKHLGLYIEI